jgi:hypothetical protein
MSYEQKKIADWKQKYNLPGGLIVEGMTFERTESVQDFINRKEAEERKLSGLRLCYGHVMYKDTPYRLYYEVTDTRRN